MDAGEKGPAKGADLGKSWIVRTGAILIRTARVFWDDNMVRFGAALAFYTTLAIAPLLALAVALAGFFVARGLIRHEVVGEIERLAGPSTRSAVISLRHSAATKTGLAATVISLFTLVFGGFGVFNHLQSTLNFIWRVPPGPSGNWWKFLERRLLSLGAVVGTGFLLLLSLIVSALIGWLGRQTAAQIELPIAFIRAGNAALSLVVIALLFALVFKLLPNAPVPWRAAWMGGFLASALFMLGKWLLGLYLKHTVLASAYGAASSVVALLIWCYYAGQIVLLSAVFTRIAVVTDGGRNLPALDASLAPTAGDAASPQAAAPDGGGP